MNYVLTHTSQIYVTDTIPQLYQTNSGGLLLVDTYNIQRYIPETRGFEVIWSTPMLMRNTNNLINNVTEYVDGTYLVSTIGCQIILVREGREINRWVLSEEATEGFRTFDLTYNGESAYATARKYMGGMMEMRLFRLLFKGNDIMLEVIDDRAAYTEGEARHTIDSVNLDGSFNWTTVTEDDEVDTGMLRHSKAINGVGVLNVDFDNHMVMLSSVKNDGRRELITTINYNRDLQISYGNCSINDYGTLALLFEGDGSTKDAYQLAIVIYKPEWSQATHQQLSPNTRATARTLHNLRSVGALNVAPDIANQIAGYAVNSQV